MNNLSVLLANGIAEFFFVDVGSSNDSGCMNRSGFLQQMDAWDPGFCVYADAAYGHNRHVQKAFTRQQANALELLYNAAHNGPRTSVEHEFKEMVCRWAFIDFNKKLAWRKSPVINYLKVAALFTNMHTCLYGNQTSKKYGISPPPLEVYMRRQGVTVAAATQAAAAWEAANADED
jgi:hypothetical protein